MATIMMPDGSTIEFDLLVSSTEKTRLEIDTEQGTIYLDIDCGVIPPHPLYQDADWLQGEYVGKGRTMAEIARQFGVTPMTINQWLKNHGINTRPRGRRRLAREPRKTTSE